jgi:hypothetical protein
MKKRMFLLLSILLAVTLLTSTASAGGSVGLNSVTFRPGSLIANGNFVGLGGYRLGVSVELTAAGDPVVLCTNNGGNQAAGQNPPKVSANGTQFIGPQQITKKGTAPLNATAETGPITGTQGGCPNDNWSAEIVSVWWTSATISVYDNVTQALLLQRFYVCDPDLQTATSVSCTEVQ